MIAVSVLGWVVRAVVALVAMVVIYVVLAGTIRKFRIEPEPEPDPNAVVPVEARFKCQVCGAEVVMTAAPDADALDAPRHCREEMIRVGVSP